MNRWSWHPRNSQVVPEGSGEVVTTARAHFVDGFNKKQQPEFETRFKWAKLPVYARWWP